MIAFDFGKNIEIVGRPEIRLVDGSPSVPDSRIAAAFGAVSGISSSVPPNLSVSRIQEQIVF